MQAHPTPGHQAGPSNSGTSKYLVQTSDVIQDMRVNVSEEGSDKVIWYKERFLGDNEIIENLVHNATSTVHWTIHRPLRGWYIRIRSPTFPPGVFIPLTPVPSSSPLHTDAALSLTTRTNQAPTLPTSESQFTLQDSESDIGTSSSAGVHSYPPTPTAPVSVNVQPPSPLPSASSSGKSPGYFDQGQVNGNGSKKSLRRPPKPSSSQITQFLLSPTSIQPTQQPETASFFARALSVLKSHRPSHSNSFTLSRVIPPNGSVNGSSTPPPPYASNISIATATAPAAQSSAAILGLNPHQQRPAQPQLHTPLLVFHDRTPVLTVRSLTGLIEMEKAEETCLGVDTSFWIAVALTYLEFLEERESYLAALSD